MTDSTHQAQSPSYLPVLEAQGTESPARARKNFFLEHWDKILGIIAAGITTFFMTILAVKAEISNLKLEINTLKNESTLRTVPKLQALEEITKEHKDIKRTVDQITQRDSIIELIKRELEIKLQNQQAISLEEWRKSLERERRR